MQEKKFTQSNLEQILSMNEIGATDIDEDTDGDIDIDMVLRGAKKDKNSIASKRGNVLPSLQRLQIQAQVPKALKTPSNVDSDSLG